MNNGFGNIGTTMRNGDALSNAGAAESFAGLQSIEQSFCLVLIGRDRMRNVFQQPLFAGALELGVNMFWA